MARLPKTISGLKKILDVANLTPESDETTYDKAKELADELHLIPRDASKNGLTFDQETYLYKLMDAMGVYEKAHYPI